MGRTCVVRPARKRVAGSRAARIAVIAGPLLFAAAAVALRTVALRSDSYTRLDWSAGLLTDEGFYMHNARNAILFGEARLDEFNNMLVSPVLHFLQMGVFSVVGVGSVQTRAISVVCGLATIALVWATLRPALGRTPAVLAAGFLAFDHVNLLYNRMGLMDTPATLGAAVALWAFGRAAASEPGARRVRWALACGLAIGITVVARSLCVYLLPAPFAAMWWLSRSGGARRAWRVPAVATLAGVAIVGALYAWLWFAPNRAEIVRMNRYYRTEQIQPRSLEHLARNMYHAALGDFRGFSPYLFRHTPVAFGLAVVCLVALPLGGWRRLTRPDATNDHPRKDELRIGVTAYMLAWLVLGWALLAVISYSPSRYYVSTYPALATIAALAAARWDDLRALLTGGAPAQRLARGALAWFLVYHAVQTFVHRQGVLPPLPTMLCLYGMPSVAAAAAALWTGGLAWPLRRGSPVAACVALWAVANAYWMADWGLSIRFTQWETSQRLGRILPPDAVLIGDVAPGLCMDNRIQAVNVIEGLCNYRSPVERWAGRPRYIATLDGRWKGPYWMEHYPELVAPERRLLYAWVVRWPIGIYPVSPNWPYDKEAAEGSRPSRYCAG
ncbi:MAG TPA: glycosyltransferase family 39 protein [Chthonomonadales bacterium]|nr:glycosyltransferase family 39 protein [Chthonomonadales bacterium]